MSELKFGACLADDMGLGKTIQVLAYLLYQHENYQKVLNEYKSQGKNRKRNRKNLFIIGKNFQMETKNTVQKYNYYYFLNSLMNKKGDNYLSPQKVIWKNCL